MKKSILTCIAALVLLSAAAPPPALAGGAGDRHGSEKVLAHLKRAQVENRRVEVKLKNGVNLLGKVGELREKGFTFEPDNKADADALKGTNMVAAVLYEEVATVQYPSKTRKFFKGVGMGFKIAGMTVAFVPVYTVLALLGDLPEC